MLEQSKEFMEISSAVAGGKVVSRLPLWKPKPEILPTVEGNTKKIVEIPKSGRRKDSDFGEPPLRKPKSFGFRCKKSADARS